MDKIQGSACYVWWLITNSNYTYDLLTQTNRLDESSCKPTELIMRHSLKQGCRQHDQVNKTESAQVTRTVAACASDLGPRPCGRVPSDLKAIVNCCGNQLFRTAGFKMLKKLGGPCCRSRTPPICSGHGFCKTNCALQLGLSEPRGGSWFPSRSPPKGACGAPTPPI